MMTKTSRSALFLCAFGLFGGACSEAGGDLGEDGEGVGGAPVDAAGGDVSAGKSNKPSIVPTLIRITIHQADRQILYVISYVVVA